MKEGTGCPTVLAVWRCPHHRQALAAALPAPPAGTRRGAARTPETARLAARPSNRPTAPLSPPTW
ncbi:hypothetical protein GCM10010393_31840 [Streptomyces gobitricini]|uniref:Uncharacterized protein n=1 Tax=Streptomyces gobitricini TaxID=68211 RepID=A0ABP5ZGX9_9ACTN